MRAKAEAFNQYGEAAVLDLLVRVLPEVVEKASAPMAAIDKMTVISTDGASTLTKNVAANVAQGLQLGTDLTGIDLATLLARLGNGAADAKAVESKKGRTGGAPAGRPRPVGFRRVREGKPRRGPGGR